MSSRYTEIEITTTWAHVVPDTLRFEEEGHHANKQTVEIRTRDTAGNLTDETRRIATSDLFQTFWSVETKEALDKLKRSAKRMLKTKGADRGAAILEDLDNVWKARLALCALDPSHPRIEEARAKLAEGKQAEQRRVERKPAKAKAKASTKEAAEVLGVAA